MWLICFFLIGSAKVSVSTVPNGKHKQNPKVLATILIKNADNATRQHDDPC